LTNERRSSWLEIMMRTNFRLTPETAYRGPAASRFARRCSTKPPTNNTIEATTEKTLSKIPATCAVTEQV